MAQGIDAITPTEEPKKVLPTEAWQLQIAAPKKKQAGASWQGEDRHVLPHNNLPVICFAFALAVFLSALDQTMY
ncbi:hypothetical protein M422DRAFT_274921, partial [Sphaerobolus stellatus SS14]